MGLVQKRYVALIALGVILLLVVTFLFQAVTMYDAQAIAKKKGEPIGMAPFTDRIDFGDIPQGQAVQKALILKNEGTVPNQVLVFIFGGIADLVKVEPSSVSLEPGETVEVELRLNMPATATPESKYSGKVFVLRLPKRFL